MRRLIVAGFVYDVDYPCLREYNYLLGKIGANLNQIAKRDTYYDNPKDNIAFERCIDVMSKLMLKYGPDAIDKIEREKWEKVQEAHCEETNNMV